MPRLGKLLAPDGKASTAVVWVLATLSLLCVAAIRGARADLPSAVVAGGNPLSRTDQASAQWWSFLERVDQRLPSGASAVVYAQDPATSMKAFMLALGALPHLSLRPYWYFGVEHHEAVLNSDFLLSYGCTTPPGLARRRILIQGKAGCVFKLGRGRP